MAETEYSNTSITNKEISQLTIGGKEVAKIEVGDMVLYEIQKNENCPYLKIEFPSITVFNCPLDKAYLVTDNIDDYTKKITNWDILTEDNTVSTNGSYHEEDTIYCYVFDNDEEIIEDISYGINEGYPSIRTLMEDNSNYYDSISYLGTFGGTFDDVLLYDTINCQGSGGR